MRTWSVERQEKMDCLLLFIFCVFCNYEILYGCIVYDIHSVMECKLNTLTGYYSPMILFIYTTIARQCHTGVKFEPLQDSLYFEILLDIALQMSLVVYIRR